MPVVSSISGLRATLSDGFLNSELILSYTKAFSKYLPEGRVVVGRDGRESGKQIEEIIVNSLVSDGRDVDLIGMAPTPTVQLWVEHSNAVGGIAITASHNPEDWNGMKFINSDGVFLDKSQNERMWSYLDNNYSEETPKFRGKVITIENPYLKHIQKILDLGILKEQDLLSRIIAKKYRIVVDAVNASGSFIVPELLMLMGAEVIELNCDGTGKFTHYPEPLPENLHELCESVKKNKADLGLAVDPDADRLVIIDNNGNPIGEEKTITIAIDAVLSLSEKISKKRTAVVNLSTTMLTELVTLRHNAELLRSPVGEINVVSKMKDCEALIGGEGSGGVIYPECHYGRDSLVGIVLLLALMTERNMSVSEISEGYPKLEMKKTKMSFDGGTEDLSKKIGLAFQGEDINYDDGIRIKKGNSWVQLRKSNTEPIIRIIAESDSEAECSNLIRQVKSIIENG